LYIEVGRASEDEESIGLARIYADLLDGAPEEPPSAL
jgi:hypothetical protein